jgi:hypothetical protein
MYGQWNCGKRSYYGERDPGSFALIRAEPAGKKQANA